MAKAPDRQRRSRAPIGAPEHFLIEQNEPAAIANIQDALVIKEGDIFLLTNREGEIPPQNTSGFGLYHQDTRYLSAYEVFIEGVKPIVLLSTAELGFSAEQEMTNPIIYSHLGHPIMKQTIAIRRERLVDGSVQERVFVTNFNVFRLWLDLRIDLGADFVDIFEVRGMTRPRRGEILPPQVTEDSITFAYKGLDDVERQTKVSFSPRPASISSQGVTYRFSLRRRESTSFRVTITINDVRPVAPFTTSFDRLDRDYRDRMRNCTQVESSNEFFESIVRRCLADLRLLQSGTLEESYLAAGIPWFAALFGRDLMITSLQTLPFDPDIARRALKLLARYQGTRVDPWRDEEPGKILHELRLGEMARLDEIPFTPYYGSVDSTPLFLLLAGEFYAWTGDLNLMEVLEPNMLAALDWLKDYGDVDGSGYVSYEKRSAKGLVNQGWKDSADAIVNPDGTLAYPPIALVEVQAYVYAAKERLSRVFADLGREELARRLDQEARDLKVRFNQDFWLEAENFYAIALDGFNKPVATVTSNAGHALWAGIVDVDKAQHVVNRLLTNDMFSGWGIRTLSSRAPRYNPMSYHLGTIWPHDNSIIAMGFKRYGFEDEVNEVATALYDACRAFDYYRLPELFCGMPRTRYNVPVRYPIACSPQAWAAGSMLQLLQAILGLNPNAPEEELSIVRPRLPSWLDSIRLSRLTVGNSKVDLIIHRRDARTEVDIAGIEGKLKVSVVS